MKMKNPIKLLLKRIVNLIPVRKVILLESYPDLSDNSKSVFDELIKRKINYSYKIVWVCNDLTSKNHSSINNVYYVNRKKERIKFQYLNCIANVVVYCNIPIGCGRKGQVVYYLTHGIPLKDTSSYYYPPDYIDWMVTSSNNFSPIFSKYAKVDLQKCLPLGYPRNDVLILNKRKATRIFGFFCKYIIWYPTVKQFVSGRNTGSKHSIPLIYNLQKLELLNSFAKEFNVLIIIKPHFAQTLEKYSDLSNVIFINDALFLEKGISSYELLASCDALLTDYSSVYYDYLLCNKPVGLIWEDIEDYKKNPGLIEEYEKYCAGGEKIYNIEDLCSFIQRVARDVDLLKEERNKICNLVHSSRNGDSSVKVVNHITNYLKLKEKR